MRKYFFLFTWLFISAFFATACLAAPNVLGNTGKVATQSGYDPATATSLSETVGSIIRIILSLTGTIFLALMVYAGYLWMTAAGEEENVTKAKKIIYYAITGLIIALAAYSITWFVLGAIIDVNSPATVGQTADDPCLGGFSSHLFNTSCW